MLFGTDSVYFIELKDQNWNSAKKRTPRLKHGMEQLMATIFHFRRFHQAEFKRLIIKEAYLSNKQYTCAKNSHKQLVNNFYNKTGFVLEMSNSFTIDES